MKSGEIWTERELGLLTSLYPVFGAVGLLDVFPGRSRDSIKAKALSMGLRMEPGQLKKALGNNIKREKAEVTQRDACTKGFREYEKVSSIFRVGDRVRSLHEGGYL